MYETGLIQVATVVDEDSCPDYVDTVPTDYRQSGSEWRLGDRIYSLPHSCDSWVIGTEAHVRALIQDLTKLLDREEEE